MPGSIPGGPTLRIKDLDHFLSPFFLLFGVTNDENNNEGILLEFTQEPLFIVTSGLSF